MNDSIPADLLDMQTMMEEELHPDLVMWVQDGVLGPALLHPLVYHVPLIVPGLANRQYAEKQRRLSAAEEEQDWRTYVYLHERPYRLNALDRVIDDVPEADQPGLVRSVWVDSENIHQNIEAWDDLLSTVGVEMEPAEAEALAALPADTDGYITVYRGGAVNEDGADLNMGEGAFSWTTDRAQADWFARRGTYDFDDDASLRRIAVQGRVRRADVLAYILSRGENEVVCLPHTVERVKTTEIRGTHHVTPANGTRFDPRHGHWWVTCSEGHEHYGEYGAAGLLLRHVDEHGSARVFLHKRGAGTDHAGTFGYPGGAIGDGESVEDTARREADEETHLTGLPAVVDQYVLDHGDWAYTTLIVDVTEQVSPVGPTWESVSTQWVTLDEALALPLVDGAAEAITYALNGDSR